MLHTKFQGHQPFGFEKDFLRFLPYTLGKSSNRSPGNFNILAKNKQYPENSNFPEKGILY